MLGMQDGQGVELGYCAASGQSLWPWPDPGLICERSGGREGPLEHEPGPPSQVSTVGPWAMDRVRQALGEQHALARTACATAGTWQRPRGSRTRGPAGVQ